MQTSVKKYLGAVVLSVSALGLIAASGCRHRHHSNMSQEDVRERLGDGADRILSRVDATDEQEAAVNVILDKAAPRVVAYQAETKKLKEQFAVAMAAETIDRDEVERIRQAYLDVGQRGSVEAMANIVDIGEVLTPAQRADLIDEWRKWHR